MLFDIPSRCPTRGSVLHRSRKVREGPASDPTKTPKEEGVRSTPAASKVPLFFPPLPPFRVHACTSEQMRDARRYNIRTCRRYTRGDRRRNGRKWGPAASSTGFPDFARKEEDGEGNGEWGARRGMPWPQLRGKGCIPMLTGSRRQMQLPRGVASRRAVVLRGPLHHPSKRTILRGAPGPHLLPPFQCPRSSSGGRNTHRQPPGRNTSFSTHDGCVDIRAFRVRSAGSLTSRRIVFYVSTYVRRAPECNFASRRRADFRFSSRTRGAKAKKNLAFSNFFPTLNIKQLHLTLMQ